MTRCMAIPAGAVRGISFDYGHVLGGLDLTELCGRLGLTQDAIRAMTAAMPAAYHAHDEAIAAGVGHEQAWRALIDTLLATAITRAHRASAIDALWQAQPTRNLWRFVPDGARALLADLSARSIPMVITSNSEGRVRELVEEVSIAQHFVEVLDSGVLGYAKPDRRIFERAAAALSISLSEMVHVGDSEAADVIGAKDAGAYAIRFDGFIPGSATRPTLADARACTFPELSAHLFHALEGVR